MFIASHKQNLGEVQWWMKHYPFPSGEGEAKGGSGVIT